MNLTPENIKSLLEAGLPGEKAHYPLSPSGRKEASEILKNGHSYRESAVGMILYESGHSTQAVLMQRNAYDGYHSREVCFPGGKKENFEKDLTETVFREIKEEIGVKPKALNLIGELTPVYIPISRFKVQPYILYHEDLPQFSPNKREVADLFSFPVEMLLKKDILKTTDIQIRLETLKNVPYFEINGKVVWGATALILNEFKELIL